LPFDEKTALHQRHGRGSTPHGAGSGRCRRTTAPRWRTPRPHR